MTLESLIAEANAQGWAVTLRQHPDRREYWECSLSRPVPQHHPNGTIRETVFNIGYTPYEALDCAMQSTSNSSLFVPSGLLSDEPAIDLRALLNLPPTIPTITRR